MHSMNVHIERGRFFDFGAYSSRVVSKSRNYELQGVAENCNYELFTLENHLPFGSLMPNRQYAGSQYRYGFNGKESDDEVNGSGASYDYGFRIYDPRLGRFLSFDPLAPKYPYYTPYQFAGNMPVWAIDLDGLEPKRKGSAEGEAGTVVHGSSREEAEPLKDDYIWHGGTEVNNFEDARWMTPKEYDQNIFLLTRSKSEIVENNEHFIPWAISDHKFIPASSDELGLDLDGASSQFCESYEKACMALRNPKERSQGVEDVYLEALFALETGYGVGKGIFKLGRWGVKQLGKNAAKNAVTSGRRTGSAAYKSLDPTDSQHFFPDVVDNYATSATRFSLIGGDGVVRELIQIQGSLRGQGGVFEWIVEGANVTHRRFIKNGVVNGLPNQIVR